MYMLNSKRMMNNAQNDESLLHTKITRIEGKPVLQSLTKST
jgi:hypothetical protein